MWAGKQQFLQFSMRLLSQSPKQKICHFCDSLKQVPTVLVQGVYQQDEALAVPLVADPADYKVSQQISWDRPVMARIRVPLTTP